MNKQRILINGRGDWSKWVVALLIAAAVAVLPVAAPHAPEAVRTFLAETALAGCHQGGSCG